MPLLSLKGLRYGWDTLSLQVALEIAVLRGPWNGEPTGEDISAGAPVGMRVTCRDVPGGVGGLVAAAGPTTPPVVAWGALSWLAGSTTTRKEPSLCRKLALSLDASRGCRRRTRSGFKVSELATGRGGYNSGGVVGGSGSYLVAAIRGAAEALSAAAVHPTQTARQLRRRFRHLWVSACYSLTSWRRVRCWRRTQLQPWLSTATAAATSRPWLAHGKA